MPPMQWPGLRSWRWTSTTSCASAPNSPRRGSLRAPRPRGAVPPGQPSSVCVSGLAGGADRRCARSAAWVCSSVPKHGPAPQGGSAAVELPARRPAPIPISGSDAGPAPERVQGRRRIHTVCSLPCRTAQWGDRAWADTRRRISATASSHPTREVRDRRDAILLPRLDSGAKSVSRAGTVRQLIDVAICVDAQVSHGCPGGRTDPISRD